MNCALHPERPATAFCQNCGKALCPACTRTADGLILCESCLLLLRHGRTQAPSEAPAAGASGYTPVPGQSPAAAGAPAGARRGASPVLAGFLGLIPGVGAMYNGQFVKAFIHVAVFVVLVGISDHFDAGGFLIAAWVFYQSFDAAHTAQARREGTPLPDPFGILDMSRRIGPQSLAGPPAAPYVPPSAPAPSASTPMAEFSYTPTPVAAYSPSSEGRFRRGEPVGAIVLIAVGLLFLMSTLGLLNFAWVGRLWPVILLVVGVWLLLRRLREPWQAPPPAQAFVTDPVYRPATPGMSSEPDVPADSETSTEPGAKEQL